MSISSFSAKILLLGEYTILNGSKALALPCNSFTGQWSFAQDGSAAREESRKGLESFLEHEARDYFDYEKLKNDFAYGLWFDSNIPHGFGVGSSGALIAAIFNSYGKVTGDLYKDRTSLARLEDFFHGSSSGLDPLVSHLQRPILIRGLNAVEVLQGPLDLEGFFLLDTGRPRQTGALVNIFKEKLKDPQFNQGCANVLAKDVDFAVDAVLGGSKSEVFHHLWHISKFQWDFFPEMIPTQMRGIWTRGMESGDYVMKLCGAGGGGFLLGFSEKYDLQGMRTTINTHELRDLK